MAIPHIFKIDISSIKNLVNTNLEKLILNQLYKNVSVILITLNIYVQLII